MKVDRIFSVFSVPKTVNRAVNSNISVFSKDTYTKIKPIIKKSIKIGSYASLVGLSILGTLSALHKINQSIRRSAYQKSTTLADLSVANTESVGDFSKIMRNGKIEYYMNKIHSNKYKVMPESAKKAISTGDKEDSVLAQNASRVANYMETKGNCYTGTKHALLTSGVLEDYGDMPFGIASNSLEYFLDRPEKFQEVLNNGKPLTTDELRKLPEGLIVVYSKKGLAGHIAITNGKGQGMSDHFDNMMWIEEKGDGAHFRVFRLTDGWKFNPDTRKLEFRPFQE